jgi:diguanylate cyclase (GGDEF)-like protein
VNNLDKGTNFTLIKRNEFFESVDTYLALSNSNKKMMALILVSIDNLGEINQDFGFKKGEFAIQHSFSKLEVLAKFVNCVFRISDDLLAVILPVIEHKNLLHLAASKIVNELKNEILTDNISLHPEVSLGLAVNEHEQCDVEELYNIAAYSLNASKLSQRPYLIDAKSDQAQDTIERFSERFLHALNHNEFELYYQPKSDLLTRKHEHVEALLRWKVDASQFVSPETIIQYAEKTLENNFKLSKWVFNTALRQLNAWIDQDKPLNVSVNLSATLIHRDDLIIAIEDALNIWSVPAELLTIEITETAFMNNSSQCQRNLNRLRESGINLSIDDFGTGYSSLTYFKQIPANELKIDKSFILNLMDSEEDRNLVRFVIQMAHLFKLKVVAEGVEDKATLDFLLELGCDYAQGFYIARPVPAEDFIEWLDSPNKTFG